MSLIISFSAKYMIFHTSLAFFIICGYIYDYTSLSVSVGLIAQLVEHLTSSWVRIPFRPEYFSAFNLARSGSYALFTATKISFKIYFFSCSLSHTINPSLIKVFRPRWLARYCNWCYLFCACLWTICLRQ